MEPVINWHTGAGEKIEYEDILKVVRAHAEDGGTIHIGTDSFIRKKKKCTFSTVIALHNLEEKKGGKYFYYKENVDPRSFASMMYRITTEVQKSIVLACKLVEDIPDASIELHMDISPKHAGEGTSPLADSLTGQARGMGFDYRIKPDAFAASCIADKHSK